MPGLRINASGFEFQAYDKIARTIVEGLLALTYLLIASNSSLRGTYPFQKLFICKCQVVPVGQGLLQYSTPVKLVSLYH
nr:unnamed protein product [Haemonchus contortus]